jgi:hypothetical protein
MCSYFEFLRYICSKFYPTINFGILWHDLILTNVEFNSCKRIILWYFCIFWTNDVVNLSEGASAANILSQLAAIKPLDETNYSTWKENIEPMLGLSELDYALRSARPVPPEVGEPDYDNKVMKHDLERHKWEKSNRKCLMILKRSIVEAIRGLILECETAREYMDRVAAQFVGSSKAYASTLTK